MAAACSSLLTRSAARRLRPCCIADPGPYRAPASRRGVFETRPSRTQTLRRSRISGAPRRADTVRAGLQERVRRVVLHRIRDTDTILADQWRHECDANISIIARDLSSAHFIGARSASPASSTIAGLARRLPASTAQAQPRARLELPRGRRVPIPSNDIGPHGIGPQLLA